jgi:BolA protein
MPDATSPSATRADRIGNALRAALAPAEVAVMDDSAKHAGHAGAQPGGETHYTVLVVSPRFAGLPRVARHRLVNAALAPEFGTGLHALALVLRTPDEHRAEG